MPKQKDFLFRFRGIASNKPSIMRLIYTFLISSLILGQTYAQAPSSDLFQLEYEGEQVYATAQVDQRYMGEYTQSKGRTDQHFMIKISDGESYVIRKSDPEKSWDLESRKEIDWGLLCNAEGKPLVLKLQEFSDGAMHTYPAMIFVYKTTEERAYASKMLSLRNGQLFLDEAPKVDTVAAK